MVLREIGKAMVACNLGRIALKNQPPVALETRRVASPHVMARKWASKTRATKDSRTSLQKFLKAV